MHVWGGVERSGVGWANNVDSPAIIYLLLDVLALGCCAINLLLELPAALDATFFTRSWNFQRTLDAMLLTSSWNFQHALDATLLTYSWILGTSSTLLMLRS